MSLFELIIVGTLIAIVFALLHANDVLGSNPHQQIKAIEDLTGPFSTKMSVAEKQRLNDLHGISPTNPRRTRWLAIFVVLLFLFMLWLQR